MMINNNPDSDLDRVKQELARLRKKLQIRGDLSMQADQLIEYLSNDNTLFIYSVEDDSMFSAVIHDALNGVDITKKYPDFFRQMEHDDALLTTFVDALDLLEQEDQSLLIEPPPSAMPAVSFLKKTPFPKPTLKTDPNRLWSATWEILSERLNDLFDTSPSELIFRSTHLDLEEDSVTVLRSQFKVEDREFDLFLEAVRPLEDAAHYHLTLYATTVDFNDVLPPLRARLQWGAFAETADLDEYGQAHFPPVLISLLVDGQDNDFGEGVIFTLEPLG